MARTLVAGDSFNRADGYGLGSNWTGRNAGNSGLLSIAGNAANGSAGRPYDNTSADSWSGAGTFTADQYASTVISGLTVQTTDYGVGAIARASGSDGTRTFYGAYVVSNAASGGSQTTYLFKIVAGTVTALNAGTASWANGDRIEIECEGTTIRLCKNGTPLGGAWTVTDSAIATGAPGIAGGGTGVAQGDSWEGGNLTAASSDLSGSATLDGVTASGGMSSATSNLSGGATLGDVGASGGLVGAGGTFTSLPLARNNDTLALASPLTWLGFRVHATGAPVLLKTGVSTHPTTGVFTVTDPALVTGTVYRADWLEDSGEYGHYVAAAT